MTEDKKHLLVTGGCGFIGSNFIRYILENHPSWRVTNLDKLTYAGNTANLKGVEDNLAYNFVKGDILDRNKVDSLFEEKRFDAVVNFAAESHVDRSVLDPAPFVDTNIKGTQVLLDIVSEHWEGGYEDKRFIQISTDEVYGELGETGKFTEDSPLEPNSPYAASKASADMLCSAYYKTNGLPVIITRSSNNYGPYQFPEKLIPLMIRNALKGDKLPVYGEGKEVRDWLYVEDNCRAIDTVLRKGKAGEVYNIGGDSEKQNIEVVNKIVKLLEESPDTRDLNPNIQFIEDPRGEAHDFRYALDTSKVQDLGWEPDQAFQGGMEKTVAWYLNHRKWIKEVAGKDHQEYTKETYES